MNAMNAITEQTAQLASLRAAEEARRLAMLAGDTAALAAMFSDSLDYIHSSGVKDSKQSYLDQLASGALRYESLEFIEPGFKLLGQAGLVTARMKATVLRGDVRKQVASTFLAVWADSGPGWSLQIVQGTPLPPAA